MGVMVGRSLRSPPDQLPSVFKVWPDMLVSVLWRQSGSNLLKHSWIKLWRHGRRGGRPPYQRGVYSMVRSPPRGVDEPSLRTLRH